MKNSEGSDERNKWKIIEMNKYHSKILKVKWPVGLLAKACTSECTIQGSNAQLS